MEVSHQPSITAVFRKRAHGTHWTVSWLGPRAGLEIVEKEKYVYWESNPGSLPIL